MSNGMTKRDRLIPWYFVGAFALLFVIDGTLVTIAVRSQRGVVVDNAYERGLAYNQYLAEAEAQAARGWKTELQYSDGTLSFTMKDRENKPLTGATAEVAVRRAVDDTHDFTITLAEDGAGRYVKQVAFPAPGQWILEVKASWQKQPFVLQQTMVIP